MRRLTIFSLFFLLCAISWYGIYIWSQRAILFKHFDALYWKDKYEQSQWRLPLSQRTIGDDGLFLYEGYKLIHGDNPTLYNAEVPPLGKYLIGASLRVTKTTSFYTIGTTVLFILALGLVYFSLTKRSFVAIGMLAVTAVDPLIMKQTSVTMLDSLQAALLFLFVWSLLQTAKQTLYTKQKYWVISTGILLGLYSQTKLPLFTPFWIVSLLFFFFPFKQKIKIYCIFFVSFGLGFLAPYVYYFLQGHTLTDFLRVLKYTVDTYKTSTLKANTGSVLTTLLVNRYYHLTHHTWIPAPEWSSTWPFITTLGFYGYGSILMNRRIPNQSHRSFLLLTGYTLTMLSVFVIIPFWTRYLVSLLPFFYSGTLLVFARMRHTVFIYVGITLLFFSNCIWSFPLLFPTPQASVNQFIYDFEHKHFQDIYEHLQNNTQISLPRDLFFQSAYTALSQAQIEHIDIQPQLPKWSFWTSPQYLPITITYTTRFLGEFTHTARIPFVKEHGVWRIAWSWEYLLPHFSPDSSIQTLVTFVKRGTIRGDKGKILAEDIPGVLVSIIPGSIPANEESDLLDSLTDTFEGRIDRNALHQRYVGNTLSTIPVSLGIVSLQKAKDIAAYKALQFSDALIRTYPEKEVAVGRTKNTSWDECCSFLYSTSSYDGTDVLEKDYNAQLKGINGGKIIITDKYGEENVVYEVSPKKGSDISF